MKRTKLLNTPMDRLTMKETLHEIEKAIDQNKRIHHVVVNVAKLVSMRTNSELYNSVVSCDIINADGLPIIWASKFLKNPLPERVAGIDLMENLVELAYQKKYKIFFLGAKEHVVKKMVEMYSSKYSPDIIAGYRNGYFKKEEEPAIAEQIGKSGAHILFVAISSPKKEIFLNKYADVITTPFTMGVGGSFDVVSGFTKRAPLIMQKMGLEWLYRIYQEPRRMWKRYATTNPIFIWLVIKAKFNQLIHPNISKQVYTVPNNN